MISLINFVVNAQFVIGFILGGLGAYVYLHLPKKEKK